MFDAGVERVGCGILGEPEDGATTDPGDATVRAGRMAPEISA